jgi:hypothetical protein
MINLLTDNLISSGHIYLRSTVPVGTTVKIHNAIQSSSRDDIKIFYAPERTAEGVALKELDSLPQIIGSPESTNLKIGADMLSTLGFEIIETTNSETAEFIKLMCNIWRDSTFAISNEFAIIAESLNLDVFEIIEKANFQYPRATVPKPGPVGGPCLSKDTYILFESLDQSLHENSIVLRSRKQNEKLVDLAHSAGFKSFCGSEQDKLFRYLNTAEYYNFDVVIIVDGDDPFCFPEGVDAISLEMKSDPTIDCAYISGLPVGAGCVGLSIGALRKIMSIKDEIDTEVWGGYFIGSGYFNVKQIRLDNPFLSDESIRIEPEPAGISNSHEEVEKSLELLIDSGKHCKLRITRDNELIDDQDLLQLQDYLSTKFSKTLKVEKIIGRE